MPAGRIILKRISDSNKLPKERHCIPLDIRLFIIKRDDCTCQYCGKRGTFIYRYAKPYVVENPKNLPLFKYDFYNGNDVISFEIDHIIEIYDGGDNKVENLILSCRRCNRAKGNKSRRYRRLNA